MAALGPWPSDRRVAVAVSGGADSLCLAWLAKSWGRPFALIVDHGLREESAVEAALAATRLAGFGVESRVIRLHDLSPGAGLAARARHARYTALAEAARSLGLSDVLLGHHARDQAETLLIRRLGGSRPAGLAGMAAIGETRNLRLVRPLLGMAPGVLRDVLASQGIGWSDDPSNDNPAALRTRTRRALNDPRGSGATTAALHAEAAARAVERRAEEERIAAVLARRVCLFPQGYAVVSPGPIAAGCLAALIRALSGAPYTASGAALVRLAARSAGGALCGTLGGVRFMPAGRAGAGTLVVREAAAMAPPVPAREGVVWDRRFRLELADALPQGAMIGALGAECSHLRSVSALPAAVLWTLPALRAGAELLAVPHLGHFKGWTNLRLRLSFAPDSPAAGAPFCVPSGLWGAGDAQVAQEHHVDKIAASANPGTQVG
jgi:tRNA(Ile)-lysidine synthase